MPPKMPKIPKGANGQPLQGAKKGTLKRLLKLLFKQNKPLMIAIIITLSIAAATSVFSSIFLTNLLTQLRNGLNLIKEGSDAQSAFKEISPALLKIFITMGVVYGLNILCSFIYTRLGAVLTQGFLHQTRTALFNKMQSLPIRFFDAHKTGDLMSVYTNDTDALRQLISQSIPSLCSAIISVSVLLVIMLNSSIWLSLVIFVGIIFMFMVTKKVGGGSAKYFIQQQISLGEEEGYIEEMIQGQKVVKVFCHEDKSKADFNVKNDKLCDDMTKANTFANILMPIMGNIGNILYVLVAFVGGILAVLGARNLRGV